MFKKLSQNLPFLQKNTTDNSAKKSAAIAPEPSADPTPRIEFFNDIPEELSNVSLRRDPRTGSKSVEMIFEQLNALEKFQSFTSGFSGAIRLIDKEGDIAVTPSSCRIIFAGDEGDDLRGVTCRFEIDNDDHWDRFMRFMHRYAEENGFAYGETGE